MDQEEAVADTSDPVVTTEEVVVMREAVAAEVAMTGDVDHQIEDREADTAVLPVDHHVADMLLVATDVQDPIDLNSTPCPSSFHRVLDYTIRYPPLLLFASFPMKCQYSLHTDSIKHVTNASISLMFMQMFMHAENRRVNRRLIRGSVCVHLFCGKCEVAATSCRHMLYLRTAVHTLLSPGLLSMIDDIA